MFLQKYLVKFLFCQHTVPNVFLASLLIPITAFLEIYFINSSSNQVIIIALSILATMSLYVLSVTIKMLFFKINIDQLGYLKLVQIAGTLLVPSIGVFYVVEVFLKLNFQGLSFENYFFLFFALVVFIRFFLSFILFQHGRDFNFFKKINKKLDVDARHTRLHPLLIFFVIAICLFVYFRNLDNFIISLGQSFYMGIFIFDIIYLIGGKKEIELKPKPLYKHWIGKLEAIERKHQNRNNK